MTANMVDNVLICTTPAMLTMVDEPDFYDDIAHLGTFNRDYPLSLEMVDFLTKYAMGSYLDDSNAHRRCFKIGIRKGCYKERLINDFGFLTETGQKAVNNARILDRRMKRYYQRVRGSWLIPDQATAMDEIIPFGILPGYALRILTYLWEANNPGKSLDNLRPSVPMPHTWQLTQIEHDGITYLLMASIRNNMYARQAADIVLKFGLIDLVSLPKMPEARGRGRSPVGIALSPMGTRFYESYLTKFDPYQQFRRRIMTDYEAARADTGQTAPSSPQSNSLRHAAVEVIYDNDPRSIVGETNPYAASYDPTAPIEETKETSTTAEPDEDQLTSPDFKDPLSTGGQSAKTSSHRVSESSDVVDGEDLRELFG